MRTGGAMANMGASMRHLIAGLRMSGSVKKKSKPKKDVDVVVAKSGLMHIRLIP